MRRCGFSLVEVIISLGIVTTAILLVVGIFSSLLRNSSKHGDLTAGTLVARTVLDDYCYGLLNNPSTLSAFFASSYGPDSGVEVVGSSQFRWTITNSPVPELEDTSWPTQDDSRVRLLQIEVYWSSEGGQSKQGKGLQRVQLTRLLNEQMNQ